MKYNIRKWVLFGACNFLLLTGAVQKKENPILKTQTDPIAYKAKMEELKEGEKGAPSPSLRHYPESGFLVDPPFEAKKVEALKNSGIPNIDDPIPEDLSELTQEKEPVRSEDEWGFAEEGEEEEEAEEDLFKEEDLFGEDLFKEDPDMDEKAPAG